MNKGDKIVYVYVGDVPNISSGYLSGYTYGKVYEVITDGDDILADVIDDNGYRTYPTIRGIDLDSRLPIRYFITLEEWRDSKIDKILDGG